MFHCRITDKSLVAQVCNRFMNIDINMIACRTTGTEDSSLRTQTVLGAVAQLHATLSEPEPCYQFGFGLTMREVYISA